MLVFFFSFSFFPSPDHNGIKIFLKLNCGLIEGDPIEAKKVWKWNIHFCLHFTNNYYQKFQSIKKKIVEKKSTCKISLQKKVPHYAEYDKCTPRRGRKRAFSYVLLSLFWQFQCSYIFFYVKEHTKHIFNHGLARKSFTVCKIKTPREHTYF